MNYRLNKFYTSASGSLRCAATDGDSIWFLPNEPKRFEGLSRYNEGDSVQLRPEGVDTLELRCQWLHHAAETRDFVIERLGFGEVTYRGGSGMPARTGRSRR